VVHLAAKKGSVKVLRMLSEKGARMDSPDSRGLTPLMGACWGSHAKAVDILLSSGANPNAKESGPEALTPMLIAIMNGLKSNSEVKSGERVTLTIVQSLLAAGAKPSEAAGGEVWMPLTLALSAEENPEMSAIAETLLNAGADATTLGRLGQTPLMWAAVSADPSIVFKLALSAGDKGYAESCDVRGLSPLSRATLGGRSATAAGLLAAGVGEPGEAASMARGDEARDNVRRLHGEDALKNILNGLQGDTGAAHEGVTPLMAASARNDVDLTRMMLMAGADVDAADARGATALHHAAACRSRAVARMLVEEWNAQVNVQDRFGVTPLMCSLMRADSRTSKMLLENGASANMEDREGKSALYYASFR